MNYRHAFHAGNFADLVKHAALLAVLEALMRGVEPLRAVDTHAGAGLYDLTAEAAKRSGEAAAGVAALMAAADLPPELAALRSAVAAANDGGATRVYPGSPWLIACALRPGDNYLACELHPEEHAGLSRLLAGRPNVTTVRADGFTKAMDLRPGRGRTLLLIDPPFERADDYRRTAETVRGVLGADARATAMVWTPLKDLETFDSFLRDLTAAVRRPVLALETRLRPLTDPMKMNGCALVFVGAPAGLEGPLAAIGGWVAQNLGEDGEARISMLS